jgi:hypothetical protein
VIPTSDSVFTNFYKLQTISRSPLIITRFFQPWSDIFKLWSTYFLQIIQSLHTDAYTLSSFRLSCLKLYVPFLYRHWIHFLCERNSILVRVLHRQSAVISFHLHD